MNRNQAFTVLGLFLVMMMQSCTLPPVSPSREPATQIPSVHIVPSPTEIAPNLTMIPSERPTLAPGIVSQAKTSTPFVQIFPEEHLYTITDQTGAIEVTIPTTWIDLRTEDWIDDKGKKIGTIFTAATSIEDFFKFKAEGISVSVSRHLPIGYVELLEHEYDYYMQYCEDTYNTRWKVEHPTYRGLNIVFGECNGVRDTWLSLFSVVDKNAPDKYIARAVGFDMIPTFGETFRDIMMKFKVFPENLP